MKAGKKLLLSLGLGQAYFDFWWRYRCRFEPLSVAQAERGFYFVHIPKTAGTSVLSALNSDVLPYTHCPAHVIKRLYPDAARDLYFFSVVRNPYDRFASSFEYITKRTDWPAQRKFADEVIGDLSFLEFTSKLTRLRTFRNLILGYEFFFPQTYFTHHENKALIHDFIQFETLNQDFDRLVRSRFSDVSALPTLRDHGGGDYRAMYDEGAAAFVRDVYEEDFKKFGYDTALT